MKRSRGKRPKVSSRTVPCPSCSAPAGTRCYGTLEEDHYGRHKLALDVAKAVEMRFKMSDAR